VLATESRGGTTILRLAHGKASAMDLELLRGLRAAFERLGADPAVRAIVLTGSGSIFSAGVDLRRLLAGGREYIERFLPELDGCFLTLFGCDKPVVAAINGHAIAGGCILAACCDVRLMAAGDGRIGAPELKVGVPFPPAIVEILRFALAPQHVQEMLLRGRLCSPEEALARGLVDEVVAPERLMERALQLADEMAAAPAVAFRLTKRELREPVLERARATAGASRAALVDAWASEEVLGAVRRYVEKTLGK
jgi:enoyl-CoA hydratase